MFCNAGLGICYSEPRIGLWIVPKPDADCDSVDITVDAAEFSVCRIYAGDLPNCIIGYEGSGDYSWIGRHEYGITRDATMV